MIVANRGEESKRALSAIKESKQIEPFHTHSNFHCEFTSIICYAKRHHTMFFEDPETDINLSLGEIQKLF